MHHAVHISPMGYLFLAAFIALGIWALIQRHVLSGYPAEVWFSTKAQLDAFDEAVARTSWLRKIVGRFRIPKGAAYTTLGVWQRFPILLLARGRIAFEEGSIRFTPFPSKHRYAMRDRNLLDGFSFEMKQTDLVLIEAFEPIDKVGLGWGLPWTRVVTTRPAPLNEFFLTIGGPNAYGMKNYREQALALRDKLQRSMT
ncbi:MAG: hypothetical protein KGJ79_16795 [Alphaproteobacteria bacterium]|nr:hypothetical protein [Alphaproteobacteria bacterium]MDE2495700.1 hypothetical protein [Alphaproteobacteria bacterium]